MCDRRDHFIICHVATSWYYGWNWIREADFEKSFYKNKEKFSADNLTVYEGAAAETVAKLPEPDKVFIGGSGKEMSQILETIAAFPKKIKVVISAVTIETIAETNELLGKYDPDFDVIQATVGRGRKIGSYHIMDTNNPVMIFTAYI